MPSKWYEIKAHGPRAQGAASSDKVLAEIYVYGNIGDRWNEDGVVASEMVRDIAALEADEIALRINSYGGSVTDGLAIYNALKRHPAPVHVHVDGVAISCASYIAMAGNTITFAKNAQMMIHAPWSFAGGNAAELREQADLLDRYAKAMASAYADKSGKRRPGPAHRWQRPLVFGRRNPGRGLCQRHWRRSGRGRQLGPVVRPFPIRYPPSRRPPGRSGSPRFATASSRWHNFGGFHAQSRECGGSFCCCV
jgi:ATP-dependent protease ClpP protease subunit